ncbi:MAG: LysM peptidoglycan-binding domain-containing protein, partial [Albidovulum sp.]|nr:LysM peptidoglycan-binding domain-containing protein [Albidovulum sp.]
ISPEPAETVSGVSAEVAVDEMIDVDLPVDSGEAEILSDAEPPADAEVPGPIEAEAIKDMPGIDVAEEPAPAEAVVEAPAEVIDDQPTEVALPADDSLAEVESTAALTEEGADVPDSGISPEPAETVSGASAEVAVDEGIDADRPVDAGEAEILSNAEPPMDAESPEPLAAEVVEEPGLVVEAVEDDAAQELTEVEAVALAEEIAPAAAVDEKDGVDRAETASTEAILDDDAEPVASDADASRLAQADSVRPGDESMSEMPSLAGEGGLTSVAQDQVLDSLEIEAEELLNELAFLDTASQQPSPFTGIGKDAGHAAINPPAFDIVRVDEFGSATVAGRAQQGARVDVIVDGIPAISAIADESGHFAANFDIGVGLKPVVISLLMKPSGKPPLESSEKVVVAIPQTIPPVSDFDQGPVPAIDAASPAAVLLAAEDSIELLQPVFEPEPVDEISDNVTIDAIYYDEEGEVVLSGRGSPGKSVIVYVDGKPEINEPIGHGGNWRLPLSEIEAGRYTLRIDEVDETGEVHSRVETPFQKELPEFALQKLGRDEFAEGSEKPPSVHDDVALRTITVQPGYTLWGMSRSRYGLGRYYVRIYAANKEQIRDPDLIYPGQVFAIPD